MTARSALGAVGSDAIAVGIGQIVAFAYPLVSLPLLSRFLGVHHLGHLLLMMAVLQLLVRLCDYGFSVSAVRRMAIARGAHAQSRIIGETLAAAALLWGVGTLLLLGTVAVLPGVREDIWLYLIGALVVGAGIGFPTWLLQGLRRLKTFALITAVSRVLALGGLLLTVHGSDDLWWALLWQFAPTVIGACVAWPLLYRARIRPLVPHAGEVIRALIDGRHLFYASMAYAAMGSVPAVALGAAANSSQVAYYGTAERFANAGRGVLSTVMDSMLPRMADASASADRHFLQQRRIIVIGLLGLISLGGAGLIILAPWFVPWYLGAGFDDAVPVTRIMGFAFMLWGAASVAALVINAAHRYRTTANGMVLGAVIQFGAVMPLAAGLGARGAAWAVVLGEAGVLVHYLIALGRARTPDPAPQISGPSGLGNAQDDAAADASDTTIGISALFPARAVDHAEEDPPCARP